MNIINYPATIKKYGLLKGSNIDANNDLLIIGKKVSNQRDGTEYIEQVMTVDEFVKYLNIPVIPPPVYKKYTLTLSQSGTLDPVPNDLENTIGNVTWTRNSKGNYIGTCTGAFPENKVWFSVTNLNSVPIIEIQMYRINNDSIGISTQLVDVVSGSFATSFEDNCLADNSIEIRVYN